MSLTQHSTLNFTCWMSFKLVDLKVIYNWVSSAYRWYDSPWSFIMSAIGDVYNKYNKGPRTDPWGTPHFNARCEEWLFPTLTNSLREDRYDFSHLSTVPWKPKQVDSLVTRRVWSTVSNAADRSKSTSMTDSLRSKAQRMSFWTLSRAVSVEWNDLYADWNVCYATKKLQRSS